MEGGAGEAGGCGQDAGAARTARCGPVAVHASYLINLCSQTESVRENSIAAFRGEVERALALSAEYLVLHPGSWKGLTREEGLRLAAQSIERAIDGVAWQGKNFRILIENTAGASSRWAASWSRWRSWWSVCGAAPRWRCAWIPAMCMWRGTTSFRRMGTSRR